MAAAARLQGIDCLTPARGDELSGIELGDIIYCVGLTADFRRRPFDTVEAHVCQLNHVLRWTRFRSLLYLSSTRVYGSRGGVARESDPLHVAPLQAEDLYAASKIAGESLGLHSGRRVRIARLSNVYGRGLNSETFLQRVLQQAASGGPVRLETSLESSKDYVAVADVAEILIKIGTQGRHDIYNVARGEAVSNHRLTDRFHELTGCKVQVEAGAPTVRVPKIDNGRIRSELGFQPSDILEDLEYLIDGCHVTPTS